MKVFLLLISFSTIIQSVLAQFSINEILGRYPELSQLLALTNSSTTFSDKWFNQLTDYTLLAPNNDAITAWLATNVSSTDYDDILKYHLLFGRFPTANITAEPMPIRSWLTNIQKANVSDGQRVVAYSNTSGVFFESGDKIASKVITGDIVGNSGFVHIIDKVLTLPSIFAVTAAETHLSYLIELMNEGNYLQNTAFSWDIATRGDSTFFAPNSAATLAHLPPNGNQSLYNSLLEYHCVSKLVYGPDLINGTVLPTFNGSTMVIRVDEKGQVWANNARVIGTNYLMFNGVMHVLDDLLDPNNVTSASTQPVASSSPKTIGGTHLTLSTSIKVGIGVSTSAVFTMILLGAYVIFRRRAKRVHQAKLSIIETTSGSSHSLQNLAHQRSATPEDVGRVWEQEPKSLLGLGEMEAKSLWVQRQQRRMLR